MALAQGITPSLPTAPQVHAGGRGSLQLLVRPVAHLPVGAPAASPLVPAVIARPSAPIPFRLCLCLCLPFRLCPRLPLPDAPSHAPFPSAVPVRGPLAPTRPRSWQIVTMASRHAGAREAHRTSGGPRPQARRSSRVATTRSRRLSAAAFCDDPPVRAADSTAAADSFLRASVSTEPGPPASFGTALLPSDTACGDRDSFISIVDDPFFARFGPASGDELDPSGFHLDRQLDLGFILDLDLDLDLDLGLGPERQSHLQASSWDKPSPTDRSDRHDSGKAQRWPPPRRESLTIGPSHYYWVSSRKSNSQPFRQLSQPARQLSQPDNCQQAGGRAGGQASGRADAQTGKQDEPCPSLPAHP